MFQPQVKFEFVRRYLSPRSGWVVYVDIDPSELGKTGGQHHGENAQASRVRRLKEGAVAVEALRAEGVQVGGSRKEWRAKHGLPDFAGDRDVIAFHPTSRRCVIAEVDGASGGQPEQKLYKAIGQLVLAVSDIRLPDWDLSFVLVTFGPEMTAYVRKATVLPKINIYPPVIESEGDAGGAWIFGPPPGS